MQKKHVSIGNRVDPAIGYRKLLLQAHNRNKSQTIEDSIDHLIWQNHYGNLRMDPERIRTLKRAKTSVRIGKPFVEWNDDLRNILYDIEWSIVANEYKKILGKEKFRILAQSSIKKKTEELIKIYQEHTRKIDALSFITESSVQDKYIKRKLLYNFVITTYLNEIFLQTLPEEITKSMFMFGFGRIMSDYNLFGASVGSDFDFNIVLNRASIKERPVINTELANAYATLKNDFQIEMEINQDFSVLSYQELFSRFEKDLKEDAGLYHIKFYKSISNAFTILNDHQTIRSKIFSFINSFPEHFVFEHMLRDSMYNTFGKMVSGNNGLIIKANKDQKVILHNIIGTRQAKPKNWIFPVKYFTNRFYDEIYLNESLFASKGLPFIPDNIGLNRKDLLYIKRVHNNMLVIQEFLTKVLYEANWITGDPTYLTSQEFAELLSMPVTGFDKTFKKMIFEQGMVSGRNYQKIKKDYEFLVAKHRWEEAGYITLTAIFEKLQAIYQKRIAWIEKDQGS